LRSRAVFTSPTSDEPSAKKNWKNPDRNRIWKSVPRLLTPKRVFSDCSD
jgi:hypothetical protein